MQLQAILLIVLGLAMVPDALAQSNVPIDSPRGNYAGADNIHWYQQRGLREADNEGLPPRGGDIFTCASNLAFDCFGLAIREPQVTYFRQGASIVTVSVFVDRRMTANFDFRWRRATDAIRRANDAFARSGVNARLSIVAVRDFDFDAKGYAFDPADLYAQLTSAELAFIDTTARDDEADTVLFVRNAEGTGEQQLCGVSPIGLYEPTAFVPPVVVLTCEDGAAQRAFQNGPYVAAHEFGHALGLAHEPIAGEQAPFLAFGRPFIADNDLGTIMNSGSVDSVPFFSSPLLVVDGVIMGDDASANAVQALNNAATTASLFWERRWGGLGAVGGTSAQSDGQSPAEPPKRPRAVPRAVP